MNYTLKFRDIWLNFDLIKEGLLYTTFISLIAVVIALIIGIIIAALRTGKIEILAKLGTVYVEALRNTPLLVQLWLLYFGLVEVGIDLSALTCGIIALGLNIGAYTSEVIRAGFNAIDKEIIDAAASLGFNSWQTMKKIKIPLAIRGVLPAIGNVIIQCLLATSLLSVLGINELTNQALRLSSKTFRSFESYIVIALIYILLTLGITSTFSIINKNMKGSLH